MIEFIQHLVSKNVTRQPRADTGSYFSATSHRKEGKDGNQNIHIFHKRKHIYTG